MPAGERSLVARALVRNGWVEWFASLVVPTLLLLIPFAAFLRHHGSSLLRPEAFHGGAALAIVGVVLGLASAIGGRAVLVVVVAGLTTLMIDIQSDWWSDWSPSILAVFAVAALVGAAVRSHLAELAAVVAAAMLVGAIVAPADVKRTLVAVADGGARPEVLPPPIVHIVLDAQIGSEGIPAEFDPDRAIESAMNRFYLDAGFQIFTRSYSRYFDSNESIPNMLNFAMPRKQERFLEQGVSRGGSVAINAYFARMSARGYRIHVYQSDYLDFCSVDDRVDLAECFEYELETLSAIVSSELAADDKARMVSAMYLRLSFLLREARDAYPRIARRAARYGVELPRLRPYSGRVSALSVGPVMDRLAADLRTAQPGSLYFAHLILPHFPYPYRSDCTLRENPWTWEVGRAGTPRSGSVTRRESQRRRKYRLYLDQLVCTQRKLGDIFESMRAGGVYENAIVIVHGDHGSRIARRPVIGQHVLELTPRDFVDGFSTLFAVKNPGTAPRVDRRLLPMDLVFESFARTGAIPAGSDWVADKNVFLSRRPPIRMLRRPMPAFAHGELSPTGGS